MNLLCAPRTLTIFLLIGLAFTAPRVRCEPAKIIDKDQVQSELSTIRSAAITPKKLTALFLEETWKTTLSEDCKKFTNQNKDVNVCNYTPTVQNNNVIKLQLLKITTVSNLTVSLATWEVEDKRYCINKASMQTAFSAKATRPRSPSADAALGGAALEHEYARYELPIRKDSRGETYITIDELDKCTTRIVLYKTEPPEGLK